jgi:hypothetical protein
MTTAGVNITKSNIVASMESLKTNYNVNIVWGTDNNPFTQNTATVGGSTSGYTGSYSADISDTNITASTIAANFRNYATLMSRIRVCRFQKWYKINGNDRARNDYDVTNITNLNATYAADMSTVVAPASGDVITSTILDDFVTSLSTAINTNRTTTALVEEFYCHSNCHGSCHGSI